MYHEHAPPAALSRLVECAWTLDTTDPLTHSVPPDGCTDLLYSRESGVQAVGAMTSSSTFTFPKGASIAGIRFRPGMGKLFLQEPVAELTDRVAEQPTVGRARLDDARTIQQAMSLMMAALRPSEESLSPTQKAIEHMVARNGNVSMPWLADQAGLSERQFRRRCQEESGLGPKFLARVLRFRFAQRLAGDARTDWAGIAADAGYFDQAHLIRDFREFTGATPVAVFSNR